MKRLSFILPLMLFCVISHAQIQFGYISYEQVLKEMPEYAKATEDLAALKAKYEAEAQKGEEEFQRKFIDFLQGQKDFPLAIMQKRQAELQTMMDNGVSFRMKSQELIAKAEKDLMQDAHKRLNGALLEVGVEYGYGYILNIDNNNCPYINPVLGVDVTDLVRAKLGLATAAPQEENALPPASGEYTTMGPIGVFDSGYGGLTILRQIRKTMPQYDYLYLGDNARAPYGTRSFDIVYEFTLQAVRYLFEQGCHLVILACNTASAKALRSIQQEDLPKLDPQRRVLGVIRPTVEVVGNISKTRHVGIMATEGTIRSHTYELEIAKLSPDIKVTGEACPMWVPLVENDEYDSPGADYFVRQRIENLIRRDPLIDSVILGCTHYPLLLGKIRQYMPDGVHVIEQGSFVAQSLKDYLERHPEMRERITTGGSVRFLTTEQAEAFQSKAAVFMGEQLEAKRVQL